MFGPRRNVGVFFARNTDQIWARWRMLFGKNTQLLVIMECCLAKMRITICQTISELWQQGDLLVDPLTIF